MGVPISVVDAFTERPFAGNPAAVCLLPEARPAVWMQGVAREMNLSETAFLVRQADGFALRWFTPTTEVDLCGHATLASAHALWEAGHLLADEPARFHTRSGLLTARRVGRRIEMDFPAQVAEACTVPPGLLEALGLPAPRWVGRSRLDYLVQADTEAALRALKPDHAALAALPVRGVIVTAAATTPGYDFVSRFFAPGAGIAEDPVTGSAHCCLGPFWAERLGKAEFLAYQASPRGGEVGVRVASPRVFLQGQAVTVWRGELV
jgi:PhzF family phenazine biosynthesis protein